MLPPSSHTNVFRKQTLGRLGATVGMGIAQMGQGSRLGDCRGDEGDDDIDKGDDDGEAKGRSVERINCDRELEVDSWFR
jgi:hypothetical protein